MTTFCILGTGGVVITVFANSQLPTEQPGYNEIPVDGGQVGQIWNGTAFVANLAKTQTKQIAAMSLACENAIYAGFQSSALGAAYSYPTGDKDQTNLLGSVAMSQLPAGQVDGWTCNFWCGDVTGAWAMRAHTAAQIQEVGSDAYSTKIGYINQNIALATQIAEATTLAQIAAIVWS